MYASSIQAVNENEYGKSKKLSEDILLDFGKKNNSKNSIYRFENVFGKWNKPNYNSFISTFSYNISHDIPINIIEPNKIINLIYIDDVVNEIINAIYSKENKKGKFCYVNPIYKVKLSEIVKKLQDFKESRLNHKVVNVEDSFSKKLYSTYLSYLSSDNFKYGLKTISDHRGCFAEFLKYEKKGQISINITKPGEVKGNHWHNTKVEKFIVVSGSGIISLRNKNNKEVIDYVVNDSKLEVIDIPPGYVHNIKNIGKQDLVTIIWCNEIYDIENPDTYREEVNL